MAVKVWGISMRHLKTVALGVAALACCAQFAAASEIVYRPVNPSFGGDPLNGNWLLSQSTAQTAGSGSPGFTIDFPDFGGVEQPEATPTELPQVPSTPSVGN